jgi:CubicO group peptidase (beta-lactamase class C family)
MIARTLQLARVVFIVLATMAGGAATVRAQAVDSLSTAMSQAILERGLVGATWALVSPSGTSVGAAGLKDAARSVPMSPRDRVQVGSVAKTFVAVGVLRLVTEGRVALDAPIARYLPSAPIENPWEATSPLRVRHLLDHTGGLDDARLWQVFSLRGDPDAPLRDGLVRTNGSLRVRHRPGDRMSYSNSGYVLLGMLIEAVTGERYESWLDGALLAPLGMKRSTFTFVTQSGARADTTLAMGHFDRSTTQATTPIRLRPAGQFTTTAEDMARFAQFLMSDGRVDGRVLVDSMLLRAMAKPTTTEAARAGLQAGYGLGLLRRDRHGVVGRCHLGNTGTFRAALCAFPEQQRAFFIAHNVDPENADFDHIDAMLVRATGVASPVDRPAGPRNVDPARWEGTYLVRPNRFAQFAYLDALTGVTRVRWDGRTLKLLPLQGPARTLTPAGGALMRASDRREATHALVQSADGRLVITDGLRSLERVRLVEVMVRAVSAVAGLTALLYLLIAGGYRSARALRRGTWRVEPLRWPALCLALLLAAPTLYLGQSLLAIGDPTPANLMVALLTGALPLALLVAGANRLRAGIAGRTAGLDLLAIGGALQWCAVLAFWGLLPLVLWR